MKKNVRNYVALAVAVTVVTVGGSLSVFASSLNSNKADLNNSPRSISELDSRSNDNRKFDEFVIDGVISQDTADKIKTYMDQKQTERKAEMDKTKAMTPDERKAYFESNKGTTRVDLFTELVTNGVLTQSEADALKAAMPQRDPNKDFGVKFKDGAKGNMSFDKFVTDGIISQDTADKMTTFMEQKETERQTERDNLKAMTADERKAYFESNKGTTRVDLFTDMVNNGVLTQSEADALKAAMPARPVRENNDNKTGNASTL